MTSSRLGTYELIESLHQGGLAEVFLARRVGETTPITLKRLDPRAVRDPKRGAHILERAREARGLQHPNILGILEFGEDGDTPFLATEYLAGRPLRALLAALAKKKERLELPFALLIASRVCEALVHAHSVSPGSSSAGGGVIHAAISPDTIRIGLGGEVKLEDYGFMPASWSQRSVTKNERLGFLSPEQMSGATISAATDLYALGLVLYELVSGRRLYGPAPRALRLQELLDGAALPLAPGLPQPLADLLCTALARQPEERFQSAQALLEALRRIEHASPGGAGTAADLSALMARAFPDAHSTEAQRQRRLVKGPPLSMSSPASPHSEDQPSKSDAAEAASAKVQEVTPAPGASAQADAPPGAEVPSVEADAGDGAERASTGEVAASAPSGAKPPQPGAETASSPKAPAAGDVDAANAASAAGDGSEPGQPEDVEAPTGASATASANAQASGAPGSGAAAATEDPKAVVAPTSEQLAKPGAEATPPQASNSVQASGTDAEAPDLPTARDGEPAPGSAAGTGEVASSSPPTPTTAAPAPGTHPVAPATHAAPAPAAPGTPTGSGAPALTPVAPSASSAPKPAPTATPEAGTTKPIAAAPSATSAPKPIAPASSSAPKPAPDAPAVPAISPAAQAPSGASSAAADASTSSRPLPGTPIDATSEVSLPAYRDVDDDDDDEDERTQLITTELLVSSLPAAEAAAVAATPAAPAPSAPPRKTSVVTRPSSTSRPTGTRPTPGSAAGSGPEPSRPATGKTGARPQVGEPGSGPRRTPTRPPSGEVRATSGVRRTGSRPSIPAAGRDAIPVKETRRPTPQGAPPPSREAAGARTGGTGRTQTPGSRPARRSSLGNMPAVGAGKGAPTPRTFSASHPAFDAIKEAESLPSARPGAAQPKMEILAANPASTPDPEPSAQRPLVPVPSARPAPKAPVRSAATPGGSWLDSVPRSLWVVAGLILLLLMLGLGFSLGGSSGSEVVVHVTPTQGALITLDGRQLQSGQPIALPPGEYELVAIAEGFKRYSQRITVFEDAEQAVYPITLEPDVASVAPVPTGPGAENAGTFTVRFTTSTPGVEIWVEGTSIGTAPEATAILPIGRPHRYEARAKGYEATMGTVGSFGDPEVTVQLTLQPAVDRVRNPNAPPTGGTGRLVVATEPNGAEVYVNGVPTGLRTPITSVNPLTLPAGKHRLRFALGDRVSRLQNVTLERGQTILLDDVPIDQAR
ncbi:MAG TPA: PEGA domain-containing protein [Myxococcaceae bacterium]|nr:PEGA domain-containing protein [Myxococcaceae bacterium]